MVGTMIALDGAVERADILPAKVQDGLWNNIYSQEIPRDSDAVLLLTKYTVRQLSFLLQVCADDFLNVRFRWADFPVYKQGTQELKYG
jgi:hypothetical protein